jgi:hypothetical protein
MLLLKEREKDTVLGDKVPGKIDRTTQMSYLRVAPGYVPDALKGWGEWLLPSLFGESGIEIGPIPRDTPVGLLTNLMILPEEMGTWDRIKHDRELVALVFEIKRKLKELGPPPADEQGKEAFNKRAQEVFTPLADRLMALSKCPDYVVNRGHYFGTGYNGEPALSTDDRRALIEFLKTF